MNLFYQPLITSGIHRLDPEESRHCVKVLRRIEGDAIRITDGKGFFYDATITVASPSQCQFKIDRTIAPQLISYSIHIAIAPTKSPDRLEWFVEKAVEIGIDTITLLECENSERIYQKTERLNKVALSAMKQSLKCFLPTINPLTDFDKFIAQTTEANRFIAFVDSNNPMQLKNVAKPNESYLVLIGPEGDFSPRELALALDNGFMKVGLGPSRLRTETAGVAASHVLNLINN